MDLPVGLYEALLTAGLRDRVDVLADQGLRGQLGDVDSAELASTLGRHLGEVFTRELHAIREPADRVRMANRILRAVEAAAEAVVEPPRHLLGVARAQPGPGHAIAQRPEIPLGRSDLLVNGRGEPSLARAVKAEIASADRIDVILAFIKWSGLRLFVDDLQAAVERGADVRILTTPYLGSTERKALDRLVEIGAKVAVSYDNRSTRLHAKAWLFTRRSGYHTAYVGSSNLSIAAMVDGQEWNVRLSGAETAHLVEKFRATIESYWADPYHGFEPYDARRDAPRFDEAVQVARGSTEPTILASFEIRPFPYQQEILDDLEVERVVYSRRRNLVVAATGTGKTVVAALDYKRLRASEDMGPDPSLLFVAHRQEILQQSRRTFAGVLGDGAFGELYVGGTRPERWRHVFASVQSLARLNLDQLAPDAFDVVVVDEFHHSEARTYTRLLDHLRPKILLGLTATPERADGRDVTHWFGGHIAAELRLWEALERDLLCPFHYFGVHDLTNLGDLSWRSGGYDVVELDRVISADTIRAGIVVKAIAEKVPDPARMRALGFCVSRAHAHFMAEVFTRAGLSAVAVDAGTPQPQRDDALRRLRAREVTTVFAVDLFNEGVDIPEVDTVLMLRPTESATVFLQQLGRGLRRADGKDVLTVLDFIGYQHRRFRFDVRYRALTGVSRVGLQRAVEHGFPYLPPGCHIELDRVAADAVLTNLREQLNLRTPALAADIASYGDPSLGEYLAHSGRDLAELYTGSGAGKRSWTVLRRHAGLPVADAGPGEAPLLRRAASLLAVDDPERIESYARLTSADGPPLSDLTPREARLVAMLFFTLWPNGGGMVDYDDGLAHLRRHPAVCAEIRELLGLARDRIRHVPVALTGPAFADVPLYVHARYTREEMLAAVGSVHLGGPVPAPDRAGVRWVEQVNADVLNITTHKAERDYSPTTMYQDYAISPSLVHWETQHTTGVDSPTGQRYLHHRERGSHILLFLREKKQTETGAAPYFFLGPARYVTHERSRPIAITWKLDHDMPVDFYQRVCLSA